jgi:hypothetical protein
MLLNIGMTLLVGFRIASDFSVGDRIGVTSGLSFRYSYTIFSTINLCSYMMLKCYDVMML